MKSSISEDARKTILKTLAAAGVVELTKAEIQRAFESSPNQAMYVEFTIELEKCGELTPELIQEHSQQSTVRTCRVCGCTEEDCSQCIKKTGQPCYRVDADLCSACVSQVEENLVKEHDTLPVDEITTENHSVGVEDVLDKLPKPVQPSAVGDAYQDHVKKVLNQKTFTEMKFFEQLKLATNGVDISIDIKEKNGKYTVMILPKAKDQSKILPLLITGSAEELDAEFFKKVGPVLQDTTAVLINAEAHRNSVSTVVGKKAAGPDNNKKDKSTAKKPADKSKAKKSVTKKQTAAKKESKKPETAPKVKEETKVAEPSLF